MTAPATELPLTLYRASDVRRLDRAAIDQYGIAGVTLMERAGAAVHRLIRERWPRLQSLLVVCGSGNNGGDGFVVARLAQALGTDVQVIIIGDPARVQGDALTHLDACRAAGIQPRPWQGGQPVSADLIVDALFGTGLDRDVGGEAAAAIAAINAAACPVVAVDVPSGINADTGAVMGCAVRAAATMTFIGVKQGLLTGDAVDHVGQLCFDDLGVPAAVFETVPPAALRVTRNDLLPLLPRRARAGHKGQHGHVLVIGGDYGYAGAVRMAAEAAARTGAGLISVATRAAHAAALAANCPVLMCHGVETAADLDALIGRASVVAIGPGLGQADWGASLLSRILDSHASLIVDADALNLLAREPAHRDNWVLTPHPGEAARLLGIGTDSVQRDRFAAASAIRQRYGGVCVLKGAGTLVAADQGMALCSAGNPGMGSGGMGDVLTGVIAALVGQGLGLADATRLGVCVHAEAGDAAAEDGERGLIATDLLPWLRRMING
jgi:ADP-dependent NAD(P)H-hydrate dehydratase / NAD(P)H-hydrate epimerase